MLIGEDGTRKLRASVRDLIVAAERRAFSSGAPVDEAIDQGVREVLAADGVSPPAIVVHQAARALSAMRSRAHYEQLEIRMPSFPRATAPHSSNGTTRTSALRPPDGIFEPERVYPEPQALSLFNRLAGIDEQKDILINELTLAVDTGRVVAWSKHHHRVANSKLLTAYGQRVPLVVLKGDVGTGKTALAESVGAILVEEGVCKRVHLLKLTGQVRGQGLVGQMSAQLVTAFEYAEARAKELGPYVPLLLLVDEADAIATSRAGEQMHHEDKAGVNTLLQRLDHLKMVLVRPTVIFITNRAGALDPAIARRAGSVLHFERPTAAAREAIFSSMVAEYGLSTADVKRLVRETERKGLRYTASDLTDKILVRALQECVRTKKPLTVEVVSGVIARVEPSPAFTE
jgi:hypothetical protein